LDAAESSRRPLKRQTMPGEQLIVAGPLASIIPRASSCDRFYFLGGHISFESFD